MCESAVDNDIVDALAIAFCREHLGIKHQAPQEGVHGLLQISFRVAPGFDGVGIRNSDVKAGTAGQNQKTRHARGNTHDADSFCYYGDYRRGRNHCRAPAAFGTVEIVVDVYPFGCWGWPSIV
jgi:hypothetical protein